MNLSHYKNNIETKSCYLDGRYFNKVFADYSGLIKEPLVISLKHTKKGLIQNINMKSTNINTDDVGLLRVVIKTPESRHSNLLIIDYEGQKIYRFEPLGIKAPYFKIINRLIEMYMDNYLDFVFVNFDNSSYDEKNPNCKKGGFCVAYTIKLAYNFLNHQSYDPSEIKKFAKQIEDMYGPLPKTGKDVEYGLFDNVSGRNVALGGLGGAALGGLVTGSPGGIIAGGVLGGVVGAAIPK